MRKFTKWIILGVLIWVGLFSIFWATKIYGYDGFLLAMILIGTTVFAVTLYKIKKWDIGVESIAS
ncbi:hypothetical protein N9954_08285 [Maribacter sp.]|nr:hypothetical protein [Maribacter sp.]